MGGGSSARYLGNRTGGTTNLGQPTNPTKPWTVGGDLGSIFAPFDRLGKPGDPTYVAGTGGNNGQQTTANQSGQGTQNAGGVPYTSVYGDFLKYAQTSLDRSYIPLDVKDYIRNYFSALDPTQETK